MEVKLKGGEKMAGHPIESIMETTMENLKEMIDVNTIVGDAVETSNGTVIIPISRVSFGFVAGGGEYKEEPKLRRNDRTAAENMGQEQYPFPFAGGTGAGVSVNPIAFLVVGKDKVKLLPVNFNTTVDRMVELVPQIVEEIKGVIGKNKDKASVISTSEEIKQ